MTSMSDRGKYRSFEVSNSTVAGVFGWMFYGLLLTFLSAFGFFLIAANGIIPVDTYFTAVSVSTIVYFIFSFAATFIMALTKKKVVGIAVFSIYALLLGVTLSSIFVIAEISEIFYALGITSLIFGIMAIYGYFTKRDLTSFATILGMFLIGALIMSIVNIFVASDGIYWIVSYVILAVVIGYVAFDVQRIKRAAQMGALVNGLPIFLAFNLYTDFISIFLRILVLIMNRRD